MDAVVLGASPNALSVTRSLGRAGLRVVVVAAEPHPGFTSSRYVSRFEQLAMDDDASICAALLALPEAGRKPFLLASGDHFALLVAEYQERLRAKYRFVCPGFATLQGIIDKAKLYETAKQHGFRHPSFYVVEAHDDIEAALAQVPTPCYVKPALSHEWRLLKKSKLEQARSQSELRAILTSCCESGLVTIAQEIIPGDDSQVYSVATYIDRFGRPAGWRTKRKLRQYPLHAGDASAQEICDEPEVAEVGLRLLKVLGHRGPATVEFRRDTRDGRFVLIEINARTILGQEMFTRSGFDVPLIAYHDAMEQSLPEVGPARRTRWLFLAHDYRAFRELRRRGEMTVGQWLRSIVRCNAFAYFALDDPGPALVRIRIWLARRLRSNAAVSGA